ncbi:MAG: exo-alpha-sialidase [Pirellulales bacterium]
MTGLCRSSLVATLFVMAVAGGVVRCSAADTRSDVFTSGRDGYHTFRIPSLIVSPRGTLLAICEGRKSSRADHGDIDLVLRASGDGGRTWGPIALVYEEGGGQPITIGNPCPVVDRTNGTIWLPFCRNNDGVFVTSSDDDGQTWSPPRNITADVKRPDWGWYATGPGVGIQMQLGPHAGRLVIPCDHREMMDGKPVMFSHVFYSDDHGKSWRLGGSLDRHTDECQVAELADGQLLINMRNYWGRTGQRDDRAAMRAIARSGDGGTTWSALEFDPTLIEPVCQASLISLPDPRDPAARLLVFSNPASKKDRSHMTVRTSADGGRTWPASRLIDPGSAAYSCLAPLANGHVGLLYERDNYGRLEFVDLGPPTVDADRRSRGE